MPETRRNGQLYFDRQLATDFEDLISRYGTNEFASPLRSTIPLLSLVRDGWPTLKEIIQRCALPADSALNLEFTVQSPCGKGLPSHTDLMVRSKSGQLAVEAKWTEPRYETVRDWIRKPPVPDKQQPSAVPDPDNRRKRLAGWLELLQPHAVRPLRVDDFSDTVYQMVHRAASACAQTKSPQLAYLLFTPLPNGNQVDSEQYRTDLARLHQLLGAPSKFRFRVIELQLAPTNVFRVIARLRKGSRETAQAVRSALVKGGLFEFTDCRLRTVTGSAANTP